MTPGAKVAHGSVAGATPAASPPVYYAWLDAVRFLSALMVVCYHARPEHWPAWSTLPAAERTPGAAAFFFSIGMGTEAVAIFFVLSGFLIGGKVIRESRQGTFDAARFAVDRGVRLYVPLIPALALTMLCDKWLWPQEAGWRWAETLGNLFNLQGILVEPHRSNAVLWSLSCEFWLYVAAGSVLPLIFRGPAGRRARGGGIWIVGIVALACLAMLPWVFLLAWVFGALINLRFDQAKRGVVFAAGLAMLLAGCAAGRYLRIIEGREALGYPVTTHLLVGLGFALALPWLVTTVPRAGLLAMVERMGRKLGPISYTLYLTHFPLLLLMQAWPKSPTIDVRSLLSYGAKVALCVLVAVVLYFLFERHTKRVRAGVTGWLWRHPAPGQQRERVADSTAGR